MERQIFLHDYIQQEVSVAGGESCCPGLSSGSLWCDALDRLQACALSWNTSSWVLLQALLAVVGSVPPACLLSFLGKETINFSALI